VSDRGDAAQQIKKRTWEAVRPSRVRQLFREVDPVSRFRKQHEEGNRIHHAASQPEEFSNAIPLRRSRDHRHAGRRANRGLVRAAAWPTPMAATMAVRCRTAESGRSPGIAVVSRWVSRAAILFNRTKKTVTASEHCEKG
jgi:hypothetical protein